MKKRLYILPFLAALLTFSACSSDIDTTDAGTDKVPVTINATIGSPFTRSNPLDDSQKSFNNSDVIAVSNGDETKNYTFDGSKWTTADGKDFMAARGMQTTFQAYYPVKDGNSYESGQVESDQNTSDLALSDFMTAETSLDPANGATLNLSFKRKTAKVTVNIVGYGDEVDENDRQISSIQVNANLNVGDKAEKDIKGIKMRKASDSQFVALVGPTASTDAPEKVFLAFSFSNGRVLSIASRPDLEAGKAYTINVTVGRDKITVEDVTVAEFTDGETDEGKADQTQTLLSRMYSEIGDEKGKTFTVTGEWNDDYFDDIRNFATAHQDADLTVDLSQVTGLTNIPYNAFFNGYSTSHAKGLTGIILPNTVTTINGGAFRETGLKSIDLPEGLTSLYGSAFPNTPIETLTLPKSLVVISDYTFNQMSQLKEVRFKGDVTKLENNVFEGATSLQTIYLDNCTKVPSVISWTFQNMKSGITVYVKDEDMKAKFEADSKWNSHGFTFVVAQ